MSRRWLLGSTLLLCVLIAALALAACGGGDEGQGLATEAVQDSGQDRPTEGDTAGALPDESTVAAPEEEPTTPPRPAEERPRAPEEPQAPPSAEPVVPRTGTIEYTVQAGDTLLDIANRFGVTADEIVALNNLTDPSRLDIGQVLLIPPQAPAEEEPSVGEAGDGGEVPVPSRPDAFDAFVGEAQAYINERRSVDDCLVPLYEQWEMPAVVRGDRCNLFDPDQDGVDSLAIVFTDPAPSEIPQTHSALVIYEPITEGEGAGGYRVAYNHQVHYPEAGTGPFDVAVLSVGDVSGDFFPDIVFQDVSCGASTCTTGLYVLQWDDAGEFYRDIVATPILIPTLTQIGISDATGDGVPDIVAVGGASGSVGAGPPRESRFIYSSVNNQIQLVQQEPLPTDWLVWVVIDGNAAFAAGDYFTAIGHYDAAIEDPSLEEWGAPNERAELAALAQLREAMAYAQLGQTASATAAAQAASAGDGLFADLAGVFLGGYAGTGTLRAGCNALNNALALRVGEFDEFWAHFGYGVPAFQAEDLCPF